MAPEPTWTCRAEADLMVFICFNGNLDDDIVNNWPAVHNAMRGNGWEFSVAQLQERWLHKLLPETQRARWAAENAGYIRPRKSTGKEPEPDGGDANKMEDRYKIENVCAFQVHDQDQTEDVDASRTEIEDEKRPHKRSKLQQNGRELGHGEESQQETIVEAGPCCSTTGGDL